ncbi:MAG: YdcF family protein, partial [Candidatus Omnitrophica bacterium]|nr:YdcF family protein [Candidatus Omnitrophota bacterium]
MNFSNLTKKFWFKTISLIIIQTFFILDVAWAGGTELNLQKNSDTLSAPIQISQQAFNANFEKFYETKLGKTPVQQTVKQKISKISWNPNAKFQKVKNAIIANISQIAKKIMNLRLNPALASLLLTPAFIAFNHKLGWAEDGTIVDSLNWLKEFIIDRWIISLLIGTLVVGMIIIGSIVGWDAIKAQLFESRVRREEKRDVELAGGEKVVKEKIMQKTDNKDLVSWWYIVEAARFINKHGYFNVEDGEEEYDPRTNTHSNDNCPDNYDIFGSGYPCPQCENQLDDSHLEIRRTIKIVLKSILLPIILASAILAQSSELGWAGDRIGEVTSWFVGITSSQYGLGVLLVLIALLSLDFLLYRYFSTKIKQWVLNLKKKSKDEYPRKLEGQARGTVQKMFDFLGKVSQRRTIENADLASADAMIVFGHYDLRIPEEAAMYADFADTIVTVGNVGVYSEHIFNEPEAIKFKKIMVELGVPEDKIITEPDSTNTLENLNNTFAIFKKKGITPKKIILMANPLHQTRAIATARRYYPDVEYIPYAAYTLDIETMSEDKLIEMLCFGLREIRQLTHYDKENWISLTQVERDGLADIRGILEVSKDEIDAFLGFPIDDKQKVNAKVRSIADKNYAPLIQLQERLEDYKEELNELEAVKKLFIQEDKDTEALDLQISELKKKIADIRIEQIAQKLINQGVYKKADPNLPSKQELFALIDETVEVLKSEETEGLLRERIDQ